MPNLTQQSESTKLEIAGVVLFLAFYTVLSSFLEHRKFPIHRGAVAAIIGVGTGLIIRLSSLDTYNKIVRYQDQLDCYFFGLASCHIICEGLYIQERGFLGKYEIYYLVWHNRYISNIHCYFTPDVRCKQPKQNILNILNIDLVRDAKDITNYRNLSVWQILLLSACLCSIDTDASQQAVEQSKYPKLNAILMGEDTFKDCVTIVLFRSLLRLENMSTPNKFVFYWYTPLQVLLNFGILISGSFILGTAAAAFTTYLFKRLRFLLKDQGVSQTSILFLLGFATYVLAQCMNLSGIISILCYGVVLNKYNYFNLSQSGKQSSRTTFLFVANICEGILFLIMGIMVWQIQWQQEEPDNPITHSYVFCLIVAVIVLVGRFINVYMLWFISKFISPAFFKLNRYELGIIFVSGLSKGATPFALFTSLEFLDSSSKYAKNQGLVLKTTIIIIVMFCTIILNSIIPKLFKSPLKKLRSTAKQQLIQKIQQNSLQTKNSIFQNQSQIKDNQIKKLKQVAKSHFRKFEQQAIKPFLIYEYENRKVEIKEINQKMKEFLVRRSLQELRQEQEEEDGLMEGKDRKRKGQQSLLSSGQNL